jgi:hypothetical protein
MRLQVALLLLSLASYAQRSPIGKWKTIDDNTGKARSIVEIFERGGKVYGKITSLYLEKGENPDPLCELCAEQDDRYKKKIIGMEVIRDLKKTDNELAKERLWIRTMAKLIAAKYG